MSDGPECGPILRWRRPGSGPKPIRSTPEELAKLFGEHSMRVHKFLRDQGCLAGLGRRLANEICHRAKISPFASTTKLGLDGAQAVVTAIHGCIDESLAYERSRDDMSSSADRPGAVHHRTGQACPVCGDTVREVSYSRVHRELLPDVSDRREGARRQHDEQVPQVAPLTTSPMFPVPGIPSARA